MISVDKVIIIIIKKSKNRWNTLSLPLVWRCSEEKKLLSQSWEVYLDVFPEMVSEFTVHPSSTFGENADVHPGCTSEPSDICVGRLPLGLNPGRAGNFPWAGSDGSLLASAGSVTVGVLDATAGTSGILPVHLLS